MTPGFFPRRPGFRAGVFVVLVVAAGCGPSRKTVYPVQGQLLDADGKPAIGARVIFHPVDNSDPNIVYPSGIVDDGGAFSLTTYNKGDGAPAGAYSVTIEWRPPRASPYVLPRGDRLQGRFATPAKSPFKATVGKEPTTLEPFRLTQES
jgi:hypothetical protein